ncbi:MAG: cell division protease FtsH [Pseudonocardiales bacterium]|nr:cell division protease FtsH [Pseudonocardiales bacterium]
MDGGVRGWVSYSQVGSTVTGAWDSPPADEAASLELADVGRLARRAVRGVVRAARAGAGATLSSMLRSHLGDGGAELPVVEEAWPAYEHVNVQAGLDAWLGEEGREHRLVGVIGFQHREFGLAELLGGEDAGPMGMGLRPGNVARANLPSGPDGEVRACVRCGLYLISDGAQHTALLLRGVEQHSAHDGVTVQIVSTRPGQAARVASRVRALAVEHNVFRGQVLSFGGEVFGHGQSLLQFHRRPSMTAADLILRADVLAAVQRQVVEVARHKAQLLAAGQHLKRGLLLYGPPGVGKTHTVRYLTASLTDTTVIQLTGNALHLIGEACSVARALAPSMLVVEDVDLIADDRGMYPGQHPMLFQLLNEMDGLAEDADVVFVLTTNRADLLEPALAARPGRVDQAVELAVPDADGRRALFDLYRAGLDVDTSRLDDVLTRTDGVTASFLKELLRRAAVFAAEHADGTADLGAPLRVSADDLDAALDELLHTRNAMTRVLLGGKRAGAAIHDEREPGARVGSAQLPDDVAPGVA